MASNTVALRVRRRTGWLHPNPIFREWVVKRWAPLFQTNRGRYIHRTRSASFYRAWGPRVVPSAWCGFVGSGRYGVRPVATLPVDATTLCATCEARAVGAGEAPITEILKPPLIYTPTADVKEESDG